MAWWKAFPSPLLLLSLCLLLLTVFESSDALRPDSFTLISRTREFAVYANEDGVPKLEKDDIPANDPQVIVDAPIPTLTPKPLQPSFTPVSEASQTASPSASSTPTVSKLPSQVTVSESVTPQPSSSALDQPPTVGQPLAVSPSITATNPNDDQPSLSPSPAPLAPQHSTSADVASGTNADTDQDVDDSFSDDISATDDDLHDEPLPPEETTTMLPDSSGPFVVTPSVSPTTAASSSIASSSVAVSEQPTPSSSASPPSHTSPSDENSSPNGLEKPKPNVSVSSSPSPTQKTITPPPKNPPATATQDTDGIVIEVTTSPASSTISADTGLDEPELELEPLESVEAEQATDAANTPLNGEAVPASKPAQGEGGVVVQMNGPEATESSIDTAPLPEATPSPASPAPQEPASPDTGEEPVVTDTSSIPNDDEETSDQNAGSVLTIESNPEQPASGTSSMGDEEPSQSILSVSEPDESESLPSPSAIPTITSVPPSDSQPSSNDELTVGNGGDVIMNVDDDESFTCTYFGSGTVPGFVKPDEENISGDVSTFVAKPSDFPDLDPEYLSHMHGNSWSYTVPVDETFVYDVILGFAEVYDKACDAGQDGAFRVFTSSVGEQSVKIDVMAIVGCGKPLQKLYPKVPASAGTISINLEKVSQQAILSTMCYKKAGKVNSQPFSDDIESQTQGISAVPVPSTSPVATAVPPSFTGGDVQPLAGTASANTNVAPSSSYKCVNFGPAAINGYDKYDPVAISGETEIFDGSGTPKNALPEAYWDHIYGKSWTYSLDVSTNTSQDLVLGFAETLPDACGLDKNASFRVFSVSAGGGSQIVDVMKSVGCGAIFQITFANVTPVNEQVEISFSGVSGNAMISLMCYSDTTSDSQGPEIATEDTADSSNASTVEESEDLELSQTPDSVNGASDASEEASGATCFTFGKTNVPDYVNEDSIPPTVTYYYNPDAAVSGAGNAAIFSSHIFGPRFDIELHVSSSEPQSIFVALAEIYEPACVKGKRVFSIATAAYSKTIDVFDEVGCSTALILRIDEVSPDDDGNIRLAFSAIKDNAMVSSVCVSKSVGNSLGVPSFATVSELPPSDMLGSSADIAIETSHSTADNPNSPSPSSESTTGNNPIPSGSAIASSGHINGNPENSPFPEFNGLIDATVTVSPASGSQPVNQPVSASNPHSTSTDEVSNVELVHPNIVISDFGEGGAQPTDTLLPSNFSQLTVGESSLSPSHSPTASPPDGLDTTATGSMHGSGSGGSGSSGFALGEVDGLEVKPNEGQAPSESADVIIVIDEGEAPSPSPSPASGPNAAVVLDDEKEDPSPSADVSPMPSDTITPTSSSSSPTSSSGDSEVTVLAGESNGTSEAPLPSPSVAQPSPLVAQPSPSLSATASTVVLTLGNGGENSIASSAPPPTTDVPQPTPSIAPSPSTTTSSDDENPPIVPDPSVLTEGESPEVIPTAVPPGVPKAFPIAEESEVAESTAEDDSSNPITVTISLASTSPTPVTVAIPPSKESDQPLDSAEDGEVQILVTDTEAESVTPSPSAVDASELPVTSTSAAEASVTPSAPVTDNQIEIVVTGPTVTPTPGTTPPSSTGDDELEDVIVDDGDSQTSGVQAPSGVSLDDEGLGVSGGGSLTSSPSPSVVVSVTGADTVIIESGQVDPSPVPAVSVVPPSAPEPVVEVAGEDTDVIEVSGDGQGGTGTSTLTGDEKVPSILEGDYKELIGTTPAGNGFSIGMGIFGALLVLLLLVLLFLVIRSDSVAYSFSSQGSGRKPDDYGEPSQGGYTEGVSQGPGQNDTYGGEDTGRYTQGMSAESRPVDGADTFGYEMPEAGLGGVGGSYGNAAPDTYAEYSSLNLQENHATMDTTNIYTRSEGVAMEEGRSLPYGSGTGETYGAGDVVRDSHGASEYLHVDAHTHGPAPTTTEVTYQADRTTDMYEDEPLQETTFASDVQRRISQFNQDSRAAPSTQPGPVTSEYSLNDRHSTAQPNVHVSESSGEQRRNLSGMLWGTGYETVDNETKKEYANAALQENGNGLENGRHSRRSGAHEYPEGTLSISSTPSAAPSPYETGMKEQLVTDSDSGSAYRRSPVLAPSESVTGASVDFGDRRSQQVTVATASVLDDYVYNEPSQRQSSRRGAGMIDLQSELSNDGPWPWWWSDQKDQAKISTRLGSSDMDYYGESTQMDKENASLPSNSLSPVEKSSSVPSTEDAKAAVIANDQMVLKPSEVAKRGHLPTSRSTWQRQYSSTSDGTSYEHEDNPYFEELRRRREPYVKTVANRLSTGVNKITRQSGESMLENARQEFEKEHEARKSPNIGTGASWITEGVYA